MACRINYTSAWKLRLLYELSNWDSALFLTLTYDNEHLPVDYGLHKKDLVGFFKRLRSYLDYDGKGKIKYYAVGEYGGKTKRPHYHAIVFGLSPYSSEVKQYIIDSWQNRCEAWQFDRSRGKKCALQPVCPEDIEYVTGYVQKKLSGDMALEEYGNREHPFAIMSKGLGLDFASLNADRLRMNGFTYLNGHKISLPRYYRDKLNISLNYDDKPKKTLEDFQKDLDYLQPLFERYCEKHKLKFDVSKPESLEQKARYFEQFYESHRWNLAYQVLEDFKARSRLRNGL